MPDGGEYSGRGVAAWPTGWDGGAAGGASHEGPALFFLCFCFKTRVLPLVLDPAAVPQFITVEVNPMSPKTLGEGILE